MQSTEEILDQLDAQIERLGAKILDPSTPLDATDRFRWMRHALCSVRECATGQSEEIKL